MAQTWNDVLDFIKLKLGAKINLVELSDEELKKNISQQVLPYFSQYSPKKKFVSINSNNLIPQVKDKPRFMYKLPVKDDDYIIDILDAYVTSSDLGINNSFIDAIKSLGIRNTWEFIPPDTLVFDVEIKFGLVVYNVPHSDLNTIKPDIYHIIFKPLCLAETKLWIYSIRSKFEGLNTPFGAINLNFQQLAQEGMQEKEKAEQLLISLPPDKLVEIC